MPAPSAAATRFRPAVECLDDRITPSAPTARLSVTSAGAQAALASANPAVSADGRFVAFDTTARLVAADTNETRDVYLADRANGSVALVSVDSTGAAAGNSDAAAISATGRVVAFQSSATTLATGLGGQVTNVFARDMTTGSLTIVSRTAAGAQANDSSFLPSISYDGTRIAFESLATNLVTGFGTGQMNAYVFDATTGTTTAVSRTLTDGTPAGTSTAPVISGDGTRVAFVSTARDLVTGFAPDTENVRSGVPGDTVFVRDLAAGTTALVALDAAGGWSNAASSAPSISADGRFVAFQSTATDIATGFGGATSDVFVRDTVTGTTAVASKNTSGVKAGGTGADAPVISGTGRYVAFLSDALDIAAVGFGSRQLTTADSVFVWDAQGTATVVGATPVQGSANGTFSPILGPISLSRDGRVLAFASADPVFLTDGSDTNGVADVFAVDRPLPTGYAAGAGAGGSPVAQLYNPDGTLRFSFLAYPSGYTGGVFVATGDVTGDGADDLVTSTGPGGTANIRIFDGRTGALVRSFFGYPTAFVGGVNVAVGDVNNDGFADIVCGVGVGGGPNVRVFSGKDGSLLTSFFAYPSTFTGGVRVAAADVNRDGYADIICAVGSGGGPNVRVYDGRTGALLTSFFAYPSTFTGGLFVTAGDFNGDGVPDLVTGVESGGGPNVRAFDLRNGTTLRSFYAYDPAQASGVRVATADVNGDGSDDIVTGTGVGPGSLARVISGRDGTTDLRPAFAPFGLFRGGVNVG